MEKKPLLHDATLSTTLSHPLYKLYTRRWFMLALFSFVSLNQCIMWITYGTLADTTMDIYHIKSSTVNLLAAFGPIAFLPLSLHSSWAIAALGVRKTVFAASFVVAIAACMRSMAWSHETFWLVYIAQFLNAAAGPIVMTVPPTLSAMWFGVNERTFATGIAATANSAGGPIAFFLGLLVDGRKSYFYLLYAEAIFIVAITIMIFFFFDEKPPTPPCLTSQVKVEQLHHPHTHVETHNITAESSYGTIATTIEKQNSVAVVTDEHKGNEIMTMREYLRETWKIMKNIHCLNIIITLGTVAGTSSGWAAMLVIIVKSLGYHQKQAQVMGLLNGFIGMAGGFLVGKVHDRFRHYKVIMMAMYVTLTISMVYFSLATSDAKHHLIPVSYWAILLSTSVAGFAVNSANPLGYEALAELSYPVSETIGAIWLNNLNNILCLVFLLIGDSMSGSVSNWIYTGTAVAAMLSTLCLKEKYPRSAIDLAPIVSVNK